MKNELALQQTGPLASLAPASGKGKQGRPKGGTNSGLKFGDVIEKLPSREDSRSKLPQAAPPLRTSGEKAVHVKLPAPLNGDASKIVEADARMAATELPLVEAIEEELDASDADEADEEQPASEQSGQQQNGLQKPSPLEALSILRAAAANGLQLGLAQAAQNENEGTSSSAEKQPPKLDAREDATSKVHSVDLPETGKPQFETGKPQFDARSSVPDAGLPTRKPKDDPEQIEPAEAGEKHKIEANHKAEPAQQNTAVAPLAQPEQKITMTVVKVETVLMPAAPAGGQVIQRETVQGTVEASPATPLTFTANTAPNNTVVRTIHIKLQPENLGEVKVSMHLKGDDLRLTVEVYTREAHGALQRDKTVLREVLEKAGYEMAEQSVAITLRLDGPSQGQQPSSNENQSFSRGNGSDQGFRATSDGEQQRQTSRQHGKDHRDAQPRQNVSEASPSRTVSGIYI